MDDQSEPKYRLLQDDTSDIDVLKLAQDYLVAPTRHRYAFRSAWLWAVHAGVLCAYTLLMFIVFRYERSLAHSPADSSLYCKSPLLIGALL